jgi:hypothetical protein
VILSSDAAGVPRCGVSARSSSQVNPSTRLE